MKLITTDEICYFKADSKYTLVVTAESEAVIRKTIKELIDELDPEVFWPIHRGGWWSTSTRSRWRTASSTASTSLRLKARPETLPVSEPFAYRFRQM